MAKEKKKSKFIVYAEYIPFRMLYGVIRTLPLSWAYWLAKRLFSILYYIDRRHRWRTNQHILHSGIVKTAAEARRLAKLSYRSSGIMFVEFLKLDQCYDPAKIRLTGSAESIEYVSKKENNVIVVTGHYGNWEIIGRHWGAMTGLKLTSVMRPFANALIGKLFTGQRFNELHDSVNKKGALRGLLRALMEHRTITLVVDQHAWGDEGVETTFFGHPCRTHISPALLHLKTKVPIIPLVVRRLNENFEFEIDFGNPIRHEATGNRDEDVRKTTQQINDELEILIREKPEQWLWAHRRWIDINR